MDMKTSGVVSDATRAFLAAPKKMLIGADWVDAADGTRFDVRDPATGEVFTQVPAGAAPDIDRAVRAARAAFEGGAWAAASPAQRERLLLALADKVEANAQQLAEIESLDNGKSVMLARHVDMAMAVDFLRYMAGWATKVEGQTHRRVGAVHAASEILRVDPQGAGRRGRRDHPVELSAADGRVEDRSCARCRLHRRAEARRGNAADGVATGRADPRSRDSAGGRQHRHRVGRNRGRRTLRASRRRTRSRSPARPRSASSIGVPRSRT